MDSQFMDAGTYAWIVLIIFFVIFSALQIRNCIQNGRNNSTLYEDMYEAGTSCGPMQSSVYTIDVNNVPTNFTNPAYVSTEGTAKTLTNDGLPSYEEAIGVNIEKNPTAPTPPPPTSTALFVNEDVDVLMVDDGDDRHGSGGSGRRHRRRRGHRHHRHNENSEPNASDSETRRHRRGFRKHLAKTKRRNHTQTD